jgi:hypothetical protein
VPAKICSGPLHVGPVFERPPAWIAGTSPAMTARAAETSSIPLPESEIYAMLFGNGGLGASPGGPRGMKISALGLQLKARIQKRRQIFYLNRL